MREEKPISDTRLMLEGAEYFLNQMIANVNNRKYFMFNLNAFAWAGRSVTFVMQSEFKIKKDSDTPSWKWYKENVIHTLDNEQIPKYFKGFRNISLKENKSPSDVFTVVSKSVGFRYHIDGAANEKKEEELEERSSDEEPPETTTITENPAVQEDPTKKYVVYFPDITDRTNKNRRFLIKSCQQYLQRLSSLVNECETLFT